jgi:chromosome segregation ATPase
MERNIATLERHGSSFSQFLAQGGSSNQALQAQIQALTAENKRLEATLRALDTQVQQWTQRSQAPLAKINEMEEKLLPIADALSNSVQAIATQAVAFESQIREAQVGVSSVQKAGGALEQHVQALAAATMEFQSGARLSNDNGEVLSSLISKMQQDLNTLADAIATLQTQKQGPPSDNQ